MGQVFEDGGFGVRAVQGFEFGPFFGLTGADESQCDIREEISLKGVA